VEAEGHYVLLQHKSSGYLLRESISTMAEVESVRICEDPSIVSGECRLRGRDPAVVDRGVRAAREGGQEIIQSLVLTKKNLHLLAGSWIGTEGFGQIERGGLINSD
jgi:hypothetical protein